MHTLAYYNGTIGETDEVMVPFLDRAAFFGDGVYDATMCHEGTILMLDDHLERFFHSAEVIGIDVSVSKEELSDLLMQCSKKVDDTNQFIYWQITRGTASRSHEFCSGPANLWIMIVPDVMEDVTNKVAIVSMLDKRYLYCNAKTLNLLPNVLASQKCKEQACYEAVFVDDDGFVSECAHSNISILKDSVLITRAPGIRVLPGVMRKHMIAVAKDLGVKVEERPFSRSEMRQADEVILTSCSACAMGVDQIDGIPVGGADDALLRELQAALMEECHMKLDDIFQSALNNAKSGPIPVEARHMLWTATS